MNACLLPVARLTSKGIIKNHKHTESLGCPENSLNGVPFSGFVGIETWLDWERRLRERDEIIQTDVISVTPTGVWKSTNQLTRLNRQSIKLEALKLEQIKGDRLLEEFARATDGCDRERELYQFLVSLPGEVHIRFVHSLTGQECDPFRADAAVAVCDSQSKALRILYQTLSHRAPELFTILPALTTINTRAGDLMGKPFSRPRSPALSSSKSNFIMGNSTIIKPETKLPQDLINLMGSYRNCTVTVHSDDPKTGYQYLHIQPFLSEERLNRPIEELLLQPIDGTVDARLAAPAIAGIEKAISLGSTSGTYSFIWDKTPEEVWEFEQTFVHLKTFGVIVKCTYDLHDWQIKWWKRRLQQQEQLKAR